MQYNSLVNDANGHKKCFSYEMAKLRVAHVFFVNVALCVFIFELCKATIEALL